MARVNDDQTDGERVTLATGAHHGSDGRRTRKTSERVALDIVHDIVAQGAAGRSSAPRDHVVATMDPVELRDVILDEHAALARAIARGHADRAARLMAAHFQAQYDHYGAYWPSRLHELIEWR